MSALVRLHNAVFGAIQRLTEAWLIATLARLIFAAVLFMFFWRSAMTKIGDGFLGLQPSLGAYVQILPKQMEASGFDPSTFGAMEHAIVYAGTYGEIILPVLVVIGLFTRIASLGMIAFIAVMSITDITGHAVDAATIGAFFDGDPSSKILDQRTLWAFLLLTLVIKGPGPLSLDALFGRRSG